MRPLLHGDIVAAARALLALPESRWAETMTCMLTAAERADQYRKKRGKAHPRHGTGSLMAAAAAWPQVPEPALEDPDYLACLACVVAEVRKEIARRA
ncbi:MAG: DUF7742 family protein [Alkalilacustris sp.]